MSREEGRRAASGKSLPRSVWEASGKTPDGTETPRGREIPRESPSDCVASRGARSGSVGGPGSLPPKPQPPRGEAEAS